MESVRTSIRALHDALRERFSGRPDVRCLPYFDNIDDAYRAARVVVVNSRIMKAIGFDWFDQLEPAAGFEDKWVPPAD